MEDLFPILLFIIFVIGPLLEALKKKNRQPPPPPRQQRRTPPRPQQQRLPPPPSRMEEVTTKRRAQESAATMVPDDLWEILTGQKPLPPVPTTPPEVPERKPHWDVVYDPEAEDEDVEAETTTREDVNVEVRRARVEAQSLETLERHPEPIIISLEENLPTAAQRHAAFHQKVAAARLPDPIPVAQWQPLLVAGDIKELRRAFLLNEVLGKPKGLE